MPEKNHNPESVSGLLQTLISGVNDMKQTQEDMRTCQGEIKTQQAVMANDLKYVIADNVEFKNGVSKFKTEFYSTRETVNKHGVWFAVIQSGVILILGYFGIKIHS